MAVRISSVDIFPISVPLAIPVRMSQTTITRSNNVLVKVTTDGGIIGWGEGVEAVDHTGDDQRRIASGAERLAGLLIGADPLQRTHLWLRMCAAAGGTTTAVGALDIALHDIAGKTYGVPVADLIGGAGRAMIPALTLLGSGDSEADLVTYETRYDAGYRWFKLKVGMGAPAAEAETLAALARAADDTVVCGDANGAWTEEEAREFLRAVGGERVRFIEQPTRERAALLRLAAASPVALCADESAQTLDDLIELGASSIAGVSLKLIKHGGITGVMRGAALCDVLGLAVNLAGKVAETSVAAAANLHCAAAMSETAFGCSPANQGIAADVTSDPVTVVDGRYRVPTGPGLGVVVDERRVRSLAS